MKTEKGWVETDTDVILSQTFASTARSFNCFVINTQEAKGKRRKKTSTRKEQAFKHIENCSP